VVGQAGDPGRARQAMIRFIEHKKADRQVYPPHQYKRGPHKGATALADPYMQAVAGLDLTHCPQTPLAL
jgi:hypothetical protein